MKKIFYGCGLLFLTIALGVAAYSTTNKKVFQTESEVGGYSLTLDSSNCSFIPRTRGTGQSTSSNSPVTSQGNRIVFKYSNALRQSGYAMNLSASSGSISNFTALTGLFSITVNYTGGELQLGFGTSEGIYPNTTTIQSGVRYEINYVSYFKLTATGSVNTNITSINARYSCNEQEDLPPVMSHTHNGYHYLAKEATSSKPGNREFYACENCQYVCHCCCQIVSFARCSKH